jgi:hypothetical protein
MSVEQIKADLIQAACALAAGVVGQAAPDKPVKADPLIQDLGLQNENVFAYEEAKVLYAALVKAHADKTGVWPEPRADSASAGSAPPPTATLTQLLAPVLAQLGKLPRDTPINTIGQVLDLAAKFVEPAKTPGQELKS